MFKRKILFEFVLSRAHDLWEVGAIWDINLGRMSLEGYKQGLLWWRDIGRVTEGDNLLCPLCGQQNETSTHLLLSCSIAYRVWQIFYAWLGFQQSFPNNCLEHFWQHYGLCGWRKLRMVWMGMWMAVLWLIWLHRNAIVFKDEESNVQ